MTLVLEGVEQGFYLTFPG